ncbi:DUF4349 domain-containing protein [Polaribacter cellanae]|uniref:DUF4349 domain-containing protein n=1 Tax=Polaribacter cellanae TaxID=2818493 RepID=A0A975CKW7_9FLAO|nr:DUF4349 domain-containing protein [Polaribacter cellanae]QTE21588.1 DUF4349 domain-containing protein [Polaribacter cellanae]
MKHQLVKKSAKKIFFTFILTLFIACSQHNLDNEEITIHKNEVKSNNKKNNNSNTITLQNLKIIKSASSRYKVENVEQATAKIKSLATKFNGYISDLQFRNNTYAIENNFTIKIPQEHFDVVMDSIKNTVAFVEFENITTKDVTEEYIDLETRLKTKKEIKERYETILRKSAKTVKDILLTEEKLRIIQEEIEATFGRLKYLKSSISYSTIKINLYETVEYKKGFQNHKNGFWAKVKKGFSGGWDILSTLIIGFVTIWPILLIGIGVFLFFKKRK